LLSFLAAVDIIEEFYLPFGGLRHIEAEEIFQPALFKIYPPYLLSYTGLNTRQHFFDAVFHFNFQTFWYFLCRILCLITGDPEKSWNSLFKSLLCHH
jgi:hypothetical protein